MIDAKQFILENDLEFVDNIARIVPISRGRYKIVFKDKAIEKYINAAQYNALYEYAFKYTTVNLDSVNL